MLRALINLFRSDDPLGAMGRDFARMFRLTYDMSVTAGRIYFSEDTNAEARSDLYRVDIDVNRLERKIRKHLVAHLALPGNERDVPHGLALMSLVKDVERIGDYTKNLAEVGDLHPGPLKDDEILQELREIRTGVESAFSDSLAMFELSHDRAQQLILQGRNLTGRCEALLNRIARSDHDSGTVTALVLGSRYYKRIAGHVLNVLSATVMPLHKLDYYDEDAIPQTTTRS